MLVRLVVRAQGPEEEGVVHKAGEGPEQIRPRAGEEDHLEKHGERVSKTLLDTT